MAERHILDAAAVLCLLDDAPGADRIAATLNTASISSVSVALVAAELARRGADHQEVTSLLRELHLTVIPFGFEQAIDAGVVGGTAKANAANLEEWAVTAFVATPGAVRVTGTADQSASTSPTQDRSAAFSITTN